MVVRPPPFVWGRLCTLIGEGTKEGLYGHVIHGSHVAMAFCTDRIFQVLESCPWSLTRGPSIEDNIRALAVNPHPIRDPLTAKLRMLAQMNPPYDIKKPYDTL